MMYSSTISVTVYRLWEWKGVQIPVVVRYKARIIGRSIVAIAGLNPAGGSDVCWCRNFLLLLNIAELLILYLNGAMI